MRTLPASDIEEFTSREGVCKKDVRTFLDGVGQAGSEEGELLSLYYDARLFGWNISTVEAIEAGIKLAYSDEAVKAREEAIDKRLETPLPGGHYSIWPRQY